MATAFIMDFEGGTAAQYDAVLEKMDLGEVTPDGARYHTAGPTATGWRVVDVWDDAAAFQAFAAEKIQPFTAEAGLGEPAMESFEVPELLDGPPAEVGFLHVGRMAGVTLDQFRQVDALIGQDGGGPPTGAVWRAVGSTGEGVCLIVAWTSKDKRDTFLQTRVRPALENAGVTAQPDFTDLGVHNSMRAAATVPA